jgi:hypothetical protein
MDELLRSLVHTQGYCLVEVSLSSSISKLVAQRNWVDLDHVIALETRPGGVIFDQLSKFDSFSEIEFIISIRSSLVDPDEDGIWHDDGSRRLAFSLSLTPNHLSIEGGRLEIRKKVADPLETASLVTPAFGTMVVFATGHLGFEHKINRVIQGERIIIAGWCP